MSSTLLYAPPPLLGLRITYVLTPAVCHTTLHALQPFSIWLGVRLNGLLAALVLPLLQMAILFLGPLLLAYYDKDLPFQQHFSMRDVHEAFLSIQGVRNHIVVGA